MEKLSKTEGLKILWFGNAKLGTPYTDFKVEVFWGGAPAPLQTPPFTWGGCRPPTPPLNVGLRPPYSFVIY